MILTRHTWLLWLAAALSAFLLYTSFAPLEWQDAAWIALAPLIVICGQVAPARAFRLGWTTGFLFWMASVFWLTRVSLAGWLALSAYCALYLGAYAWLCAGWFRLAGTGRWWLNSAWVLLSALAWAGLEYLRGVLFTGFPWNSLAASQTRNPTILQWASLGGSPLVSALVAALNASIAITILLYLSGKGWRRKRPHVELLVGLTLVALAFTGGLRMLRDGLRSERGYPLRAGLVQTGIPQSDKWDEEMVETIYGRLRQLTEEVQRVADLDLIVWPETALPDDVRLSRPSYDLVYELATQGIPILVGSMDTRWNDDGPPSYYNSSFLFDGSGRIVQEYDKQHLVMFGEYVPLEKQIPFVKALTPIQASFSPGRTSTVFRLESPPVAFSVLICFEDTLAYLARDAVRNGARLLINQTNDAWFDRPFAERALVLRSSASRQHMAQCVLRCVENRVPALRVGNTGVTCSVDAFGRLLDVLQSADGGTTFAGWSVNEVRVPGHDHPPTFYTRHGDWAGQAGAAVAIVWTCAILVSARRRETGRDATSPVAA